MFSYLLINLSLCQTGTGSSTICKRTHDLLLLFCHIYIAFAPFIGHSIKATSSMPKL